jgi:O-antigen/teichoic acid export membrane protein
LATSLSPVTSLAIQFGTVPLLLTAWGPAKYGDWLILSAIPSYLTFSDLGFGDASGSDMTARVANDDQTGALRTFQSSWLLLNVMSVVAMALAALAVWFGNWQSWLHLSSTGTMETARILSVLAMYVIVSQQNGVIESGYRCSSQFARGNVGATVLRLVEVCASSVVGAASGSLFAAALTLLCCRVIGTIVYAAILYRSVPWLRLGIRHASLSCIRSLALPALGFIALPAAFALAFQGTTILIAAVLGPLAVTAFATLRTLTRSSSQAISALSHALWPELSRALGRGDLKLARALHRGAYQAALAVSAAGGLALWLTGPAIYRFWTRNTIPFNRSCFAVLIFAAIANSLWSTSLTVAMSSNRHHKLAFTYLLTSAASLALGSQLLGFWGITGMAIALLSNDVLTGWTVLRSSLRQLSDGTARFASAVLRFAPAARPIAIEVTD